MIKRVGAIALVIITILFWLVTLKGIGPVGPIKDSMKLGLDISGGVYVVMEADTSDILDADLSKVMEQTKQVIENRVNSMGISETLVTVEGDNRIRVEMPGVSNAADAIDSIGQVALLQFQTADGKTILDGKDIKDSSTNFNAQDIGGGYEVTLEFTAEGRTKFLEATTLASGGTVTVKTNADGTPWTWDDDGNIIPIEANQVVIMLDDDVISSPRASNPIDSSSAVITGNFTEDEASRLSALIRGGALPVSLTEVESSQVGATLGIDALKDSILAGIIGVILIFLLLIFVYRLLGFAAAVALMLYIPALLWTIVLFGGVLTLPGMAGIILSIGMAVDANVIIFARVKEEAANGRSLLLATSTGSKRAMSTIIDSQLTTIIACIVLYMFGTGPVKGFALTLMIGIVIGIITAVLIANLYVHVICESRFLSKPKLIGVKESGTDQHTQFKKRFAFIKNRKIFYIVSIAILVIGFGVGGIRAISGGNFFNEGIDFSGGTKIEIDMQKKVESSDIEKTLADIGINNTSVVRYDSKSGSEQGIIIRTTDSMNSEAREGFISEFTRDYGLDASSVESFENFGPSIGTMLKQNAVISVLIAAIFMLLYIIIRFRWRFGVAAIAGVIHDVLIMISLYALFNMTVNNPFIATILTVVGYSINDTIVIFDRIRENLTGMSRKPLDELVDVSINQTLVRSVLTSLSTLLAILPLVILGGSTIREFAIPLTIGIIAGACSSIFVSSPLFYDLNRIGGKNRRGKYSASIGAGNAPKNDYAAKTGAAGTKGKKKKSKSQRKPGDGAVV